MRTIWLQIIVSSTTSFNFYRTSALSGRQDSYAIIHIGSIKKTKYSCKANNFPRLQLPACQGLAQITGADCRESINNSKVQKKLLDGSNFIPRFGETGRFLKLFDLLVGYLGPHDSGPFSRLKTSSFNWWPLPGFAQHTPPAFSKIGRDDREDHRNKGNQVNCQEMKNMVGIIKANKPPPNRSTIIP